MTGGASTINLTVTDMPSDFEQALEDVMTWRERGLDPQSGWLLVEQAGDSARAKAEGKLA